jgi:hypothetical protein
MHTRQQGAEELIQNWSHTPMPLQQKKHPQTRGESVPFPSLRSCVAGS